MGLALQKSTDGGTTFQQVSVDVADYTTDNSVILTQFRSCKDSNNNTYILCGHTSTAITDRAKIIKISSTGAVSASYITGDYFIYQRNEYENNTPTLSRDETKIFVQLAGDGKSQLYSINVADICNGAIVPTLVISNSNSTFVKFAIYQDSWIWVASGSTVKIYKYDTKEWKASETAVANILAMCCGSNNTMYCIVDYSGGTYRLYSFVFDGVNTINKTSYNINTPYAKQILIDRFGDLNILTNTGIASQLLKYNNIGELIDTVNLSVGTNKGAYGLQVYSSDNGTKCWVQFSNDLGTWRTEAKSYDATPANRTFGEVRKIRDNGVTTYGDDHGGDNNYSVRC